MNRLTLLFAVALLATQARANDSGEQIYKRLCASCHGEKGEGVADQYANPLAGDRSVKELAAYIDKSMPQGEPEACGAEESSAVAQYIYDAFYSPIAQARNSPARIELSRLTVRQYQNAVADLIDSFREENGFSKELGLRATYYNARNFRNDKKVIERRDEVVNFNFGDKSPEKDKIGVEEFAAKWDGSLYAPETAEYEMILRTENGARLFVNDHNDPLIDAWVRSGPDTEFKATIKLLGGRVYPIRVEFFKFKEKSASIALYWKLPHRQPELVPTRVLHTNGSHETYIVNTPFPPDDRSVGFEKGSAISKAWDAATTDAAIETAEYLVPRLKNLYGVKFEDPNAKEKLTEFCRVFAERAFRRPLSKEEATFYIDRSLGDAPDLETAAKRAILLTLKSPRFLYREFDPQPTQFDIASKLSFALWDAPPDKELREAAQQNKLTSHDEIQAHAQRMLKSPRTRAKLQEFFQKWLKLDHLTDVTKDNENYPGFTPEIVGDLRTSLDLWVDEIVWSNRPDYRRLFTEDFLFLNGRLAGFYGAELMPDADFSQLRHEPEMRSGILTHPYLLAGFAYTSSTSPIHRGVFISRSILGRALRPPPEAVSPFTADVHPNLTTRDRVELQTKSESCQSCHSMINPLGFTLEQFDPVGRFRTTEKGQPVNSIGKYTTRKGDEVAFASVRELANFLANSEESHTAFVEQLFHHLIKQPIRAYGPEMSIKLKDAFVQNNFDIQRLIVEISTAAAEYRAPMPQ